MICRKQAINPSNFLFFREPQGKLERIAINPDYLKINFETSKDERKMPISEWSIFRAVAVAFIEIVAFLFDFYELQSIDET